MQSTQTSSFSAALLHGRLRCAPSKHSTVWKGQRVGRGSGQGESEPSFCRWPTLRLWASPCIYVGLSFTHKIREMVQLSDSDKVGLVFTQVG